MDPAKMNIKDLRSELRARGIGTKWGKPILVERLKNALETETLKGFPAHFHQAVVSDSEKSRLHSNAHDQISSSGNRRVRTRRGKRTRSRKSTVQHQQSPSCINNDHLEQIPTIECLRLSPMDLPRATSRPRDCTPDSCISEIISVDCSHNTKRMKLDSEQQTTSKIKQAHEIEEDMAILKIKEVKQEIETEMETVLQSNFQIKQYDRSLVLIKIRELLDRRFQEIFQDVSINNMTINQILSYYQSRYSKGEDKSAIERILFNNEVDFVVPSEQIIHVKPKTSETEELLEFNRKLLEAKTQIVLDVDSTVLRDYNDDMPEKDKTLLLKVFCNIVKERLEHMISKNQSWTTDDIVKEYTHKYTFRDTKELIEKIIKDNPNGFVELDRSSPEKSPLALQLVDDEFEVGSDIWAEVDELLMDIQRDFEFVSNDTETGDESSKMKTTSSYPHIMRPVNKLKIQMKSDITILFFKAGIHDSATRRKLVEAIRAKIVQRIVAFSEGREYSDYEIVTMYREIYPKDKDAGFLEEVLKEVKEGKYDSYVKSDIEEKDCNKDNVRTGPQNHDVPEESIYENRQTDKSEKEPEQRNNVKHQEMSDRYNIRNQTFVSKKSKMNFLKSVVKTISRNPGITRCVNKLQVKMKGDINRVMFRIGDDDLTTRCKLVEAINMKMRERIVTFVEGQVYSDYEIIKIYRVIHPKDKDAEFLEEALREVKDGKYDNYLLSIIENNCKKNYMKKARIYVHRHIKACNPDPQIRLNKKNKKQTVNIEEEPKQIDNNAENNKKDEKTSDCDNIRNQNVRHLVDMHVTNLLSLPTVAGVSTLRKELLNPVIVATDALRKLDLPVDQWSFLLLHIVLSKLPTDVKGRFEQLHGGDEPTHLPLFDELLIFLEQECHVVDNPPGAQHLTASSLSSCSYCNKPGHSVTVCRWFLAQQVERRRVIASSGYLQLPYRCLGNNFNRKFPNPRNLASPIGFRSPLPAHQRPVYSAQTFRQPGHQRPVYSAQTSHVASTKNMPCLYCNVRGHKIIACPLYKNQPVQRRWDFVNARNRCRRCLGVHYESECRAIQVCQECGGDDHHTSLHRPVASSQLLPRQLRESQTAPSE